MQKGLEFHTLRWIFFLKKITTAKTPSQKRSPGLFRVSGAPCFALWCFLILNFGLKI